MDFPSSGNPQGNTSDLPMHQPEDPPSGFNPAISLPKASEIPDKLLCMTRKWWFFALFLSTCLILILIIGCLATPKWVKTGSDSMKIEGGLLSCSSCDPPFSDLSYSDAADDNACDSFMPDYTGYCDMFKDLKGAGGAFLFFDLVTFFLVLLWCVKLFLLFRNSSFFLNPRWLFFVISTVSTCTHILGLIIWGGVSSATFHGDCSGWSPDGSKPELCSTDGPALAITVMVFLLITTVVFWVVQCKEKREMSGELNFRPADVPNRPPEADPRDAHFSPAIELQIPNNL